MATATKKKVGRPRNEERDMKTAYERRRKGWPFHRIEKSMRLPSHNGMKAWNLIRKAELEFGPLPPEVSIIAKDKKNPEPKKPVPEIPKKVKADVEKRLKADPSMEMFEDVTGQSVARIVSKDIIAKVEKRTLEKAKTAMLRAIAQVEYDVAEVKK